MKKKEKKSKQLKISFILPVYNGEVQLNECIESLLKQKGPKEIIVINDGSTDHTEEVCKFFGKKIKYYSFVNREGSAYCRNIGNGQATGDIIAVCDVDVYLKKRADAIRDFFKLYPEATGFHSAAVCKNAVDPKQEWMHPFKAWDFNSKCTICHPTMAFRTETALKYPYSEETIESDLYEFMILDMNKGGETIGGTDEHLMIKLEGHRTRDKVKSNKIKMKKYKQYKIKVKKEEFQG